ncbi:MAG: tRNA pseudouridine(38-40) synthase TruA [Chloroflexi bacterium]|nr:tRNA pseudouridine(38-40) synthase TruA [Chloroflexota bacterium]
MPLFKAIIEYDGTNYYGFQRQRDGFSTIQGSLEQALTDLTKCSVTITGAGRTDRGVHATGQVISFLIDWQHGENALQRALNANLPSDIAVLQIKEVPSSFHPRYGAQRRAYVYHIYNVPTRSPIRRLSSWHIRRPLDISLMNRAANALIGVHDFATFGQPPQGISTVRELFNASWKRDGEMIRFYVEANAFLYRMVRSLVGSLKLVGDGTWTVEAFVDAFHSCDRGRSGMVAPPHGLYLVSVTYD